VIVVTWVKIVINPINNPTGVFSGVTRITGGQKGSSTPNIVQYNTYTAPHPRRRHFSNVFYIRLFPIELNRILDEI
jgi:hypothetical protein